MTACRSLNHQPDRALLDPAASGAVVRPDGPDGGRNDSSYRRELTPGQGSHANGVVGNTRADTNAGLGTVDDVRPATRLYERGPGVKSLAGSMSDA